MCPIVNLSLITYFGTPSGNKNNSNLSGAFMSKVFNRIQICTNFFYRPTVCFLVLLTIKLLYSIRLFQITIQIKAYWVEKTKVNKGYMLELKKEEVKKIERKFKTPALICRTIFQH